LRSEQSGIKAGAAGKAKELPRTTSRIPEEKVWEDKVTFLEILLFNVEDYVVQCNYSQLSDLLF